MALIIFSIVRLGTRQVSFMLTTATHLVLKLCCAMQGQSTSLNKHLDDQCCPFEDSSESFLKLEARLRKLITDLAGLEEKIATVRKMGRANKELEESNRKKLRALMLPVQAGEL